MSLAAVTMLAVALVTSPGNERPDGARGCSTRAEGPGRLEVGGKANLRIGPVVFFGLGRPARFDRLRGRDPSLKSAIAVRAGAPVLIRIPPEARRDIALQYAVNRDGSFPDVKRVADGQRLVRVKACPPNTRRFSGPGRVGRWTAYPGGFVLRAAGCYPIEVAREGKPFKRRLAGFGKRCPPAQKS